jgi:hypothetical protein
MPGTSTYAPAVLSLGALLGGSGLAVAILLTAIFLGWRATEGEMLRIPFLGDFAEEKMLDQTGMTRRQFEAMLEASMKGPETEEEEIPFPELQPEPARPATAAPSSVDKLEAARRARQAQASTPSPSSRGAASGWDRPSQPKPPQVGGGQPRAWDLAAAGPKRPEEPKPVVREVDLIGHYKDKRVETAQGGKNADVLRQWLSSVDQE